MNLAFSQEQVFIQQQAADFLREQCDMTAVRSVLDGSDIFHQSLWQQIVDLGWTAMTIPETYGGLGLGYLELCVIAQELGAALAPVPFLSSIVMATDSLKLSNDDSLKKHWLPKLASGNVIATLALFDGAEQPCRVTDGKISGRKLPVMDGNIANIAIVSAVDDNHQQQLYLVDIAQQEVTVNELASMDPSKNIADISFEQAAVTVISYSNSTESIIDQLLDTAAVVCAFEQIGGAEKAMQAGIAYTKNRYAFGRQVASFQAIKHIFADMFVALELAKSNAYYGAWALSSAAVELPLAAATARVSASEAFYSISKENIEVHGGMGFTWEFDCHLYYRRAQFLAATIGTMPQWQDKLVNALLDQGLKA
jgi:acyl-CoA dehydrogenase